MIRKKAHADLDPWWNEHTRGLVASFAQCASQGTRPRSSAAIRCPGPTDDRGQRSPRSKLVKRLKMYGRAKLDLLQAG